MAELERRNRIGLAAAFGIRMTGAGCIVGAWRRELFAVRFPQRKKWPARLVSL